MKTKLSYIMALVMIFGMFLVAQIMNEKEIIFPEIAALVMGAWVAKRQPWKVSPIKMIVLMGISSIIGVVMVRYFTGPLLLKAMIAFIFVAFCLIITKTTMVPMISACILPIFLDTDTIVYPIAVTTMTILIVVIQEILVKYKCRCEYTYKPVDETMEVLGWLWIKRCFLFFLIGSIPILLNELYFIAPPLIVTLIEISDEQAKCRKRPKELWYLITVSGLIGVFCRMILVENIGVPLCVGGVLALMGIFIFSNKLEILFPPAGAIGLLPMILSENGLWKYPFEVSLGCAVIILLGIRFFAVKEKEENIFDSI